MSPAAVAGVRLGFQQQLFDLVRGVQVVKFSSLPPLQPADTYNLKCPFKTILFV